MAKQTDVPKFATLLYEVRRELDITWLEYVYLDMVFYLSHDGWCYKSLENVAVDLGVDKSSVFRMRKRLISKGLLKKNVRGHVKTTVEYAKRLRTKPERMQNAYEPYAKRLRTVGETPTKNNNRTTEDNKSFHQIAFERMRRLERGT